MKRIIILICLLGFFWTSAQIDAKAQWISNPDFKHAPNQWFQLRKSFNLKKVPHTTLVKIAVDSKYWLWVNGKMVVREGMLKRGPNPNSTYFDEVDIKTYLKEGENIIAVLAWYFGRQGFSHNDSKKFGFLFDGNVGEEHLVSDASWKIKKSTSYQGIKEGKPANFRLPESHVNYVAHEDIEGWQNEDFDDSLWESATEFGVEGDAPWGDLVKRPIPQWKDFGLTKISALERKGNRVTMKLPYNMQFSYWIKVSAKKGQTINITTDTFKWLNDTPIRAKYIAKEGIQEYEHFPWMSGHEVYFDLEDGVELLEAGYRETGYATKMDGKFEIDDPYMMRLLQKANRTLYVNMRDTYFDCPDRERAQWWGDLVLLMEESFYVLDNQAHALSYKAIHELVDWQKEDGVLFSPIPAGNWDKELPQQMLAAIALGFKNYMMYTGDEETYKYVYPHVKRYLNLWNVENNGHVTFKSGGWNWSDWGTQVDVELLEQAWYFMALQTYADIAKKVGEQKEFEEAMLTAAKIKKFVNENYWTNIGYKSNDYKEEIDDRGNAMMVVAGIAETEKFETIAKLLKDVRHSSPYLDKYELEALFLMNKSEQALERIKTRYKPMVDSNYTTLWELFDMGDSSYNHGWSGGPLSMMYKYIAGIQPTKMGFEEFQVFPEPISYKNINCSFSTVKGEIALQYSKVKNKTVNKITVPNNATAIVRIPINNSFWRIKGGEYSKDVNKADDTYLYYKLSAGHWKVVYKD